MAGEAVRHVFDPAAAAANSGDPFGGRRRNRSGTKLAFQTADRMPLYLALGPEDAGGAARALASAWRTLGIRRHDTVLISDYGTSPLTLFASWCFAPYLEKGAADLLGAVPICNDGLPEFAGRALHILRHLRPQVMIIDRGQVPAFSQRVADESVDIAALTSLIVVSSDEDPLPAEEQADWARSFGVPIRSLLSCNAALFFAAECEQGAVHVDRRHYAIEAVDSKGEAAASGLGTLCISNKFLRATAVDHHLANVQVAIAAARCPCGRPGRPLRCLA